jgi:hypothetical protein
MWSSTPIKPSPVPQIPLDLGSNPGRHNEKSASNRLSCDTLNVSGCVGIVPNVVRAFSVRDLY